MQRPSFEEVQHYCLLRRNNIDPAAFVDYYDSVGWKVGKKPMKDWQACVRTWERNRKAVAQTKAIINRMADTSWAD